MISYLRRTMSGAAGNGLGTTIKYLRRTTHSERRRGQRPGPIRVITDVLIHHKSLAFAFCVRAFVSNKKTSTAEVRGLGAAQCVRVRPEFSRCVSNKLTFSLEITASLSDSWQGALWHVFKSKILMMGPISVSRKPMSRVQFKLVHNTLPIAKCHSRSNHNKDKPQNSSVGPDGPKKSILQWPFGGCLSAYVVLLAHGKRGMGPK
jgi:hypothetical protein